MKNIDSLSVNAIRSLCIDEINKAITNHDNIVLHGEGGCGKTAIIKDLLNSTKK